jgi:hypothetical protein
LLSYEDGTRPDHERPSELRNALENKSTDTAENVRSFLDDICEIASRLSRAVLARLFV